MPQPHKIQYCFVRFEDIPLIYETIREKVKGKLEKENSI